MKFTVYPIRLFFTQKTVLTTSILSLVLNIIMWGYIIIMLPPSSEFVFLHYNILFGVDLVGPWWRLLLMPILGLVVLIINMFIGWISYQYDKLISTVVLYIAILIQILLWLATYRIIFLNS